MSAKRADNRRAQRNAEREERLKNKEMAPYVKHVEKTKKKALPNRKSAHETQEEELKERQEVAEMTVKTCYKFLSEILEKMSRIKDPRDTRKIKYKMQTLLIYGILISMYHIGSRRNANKVISQPIFFDNLKEMYPELVAVPHADTLADVLKLMDIDEIQECMIELLKDLIRRKKFKNFLVRKRFIVAIDGSQKFRRNYKWAEECLEAHVGKDKVAQYYTYVLEAALVLDSGIVLPVMTEFIENKHDSSADFDTQSLVEKKQDCERKGFYRMANKLKKIFGTSKLIIVADGLYACGPVVSICNKNDWDYMIVLKQDSIPSVWDEALALMDLNIENSAQYCWGNRIQKYFWANEIEYSYVVGKVTKIVTVNVVVCYESWEEKHTRSTGEIEKKETRYVWLSSKQITQDNVFNRCTKIARFRWQIENNFLVEKHQGYEFEHCYSYNWNAMKGFHYLMKIGHFINVMALNSELLTEKVQELGIRGFINKLKLACQSTILDKERLFVAKEEKFIHRFKMAG
jgi:hypothetical protein